MLNGRPFFFWTVIIPIPLHKKGYRGFWLKGKGGSPIGD